MKTLLFDLDNTLYPPERDLFSLIDVRINDYMERVVRIDPDQVDGLRRRYWKDYGATLQGLVRHFAIDPEDYLDYVHQVDVHERLKPHPELRKAIEKLPQTSYIFTNGSREHAENVLDALGLQNLFAGIFDIRVAAYQPKPNRDPYNSVLQQLKVNAQDCGMIEDSLANLRTAKQLGMTTIFVGAGRPSADVDHQVENILAATETATHIAQQPLAGRITP